MGRKTLKSDNLSKKEFDTDSPYVVNESFKDGLRHYSHATENNAKVIANKDSGFPGGHGADEASIRNNGLNDSARQFEAATVSEIARLVTKNSHGKLSEDDYYPSEIPNQALLDQYGFSELKAVPADTNKATRLRQYNQLAQYPEMKWCLDEISRDYFRQNSRGNVVELKLRCLDMLDAKQQEIIKDEFRRFVALFQFEKDGETMIRNFLAEGEICFENVIDPDNPEKGIIGVNYIPNRYYNFIVSEYGLELKGIYVDKRIMKADAIYGSMIGAGGGDGFGRARNVFNAVITTPAFTFSGSIDENMIPMPWSQVTYCNSGTYSDDRTIVYPMIETVATPIRQLMLLHDAAVILRVTRAPQKLKFTLDGGKMSAKKIKEQLIKIANGLKSRKTATPTGEMRSTYDATTMLDAYFLWKTEDSAGLSVETFGDTAKYNEMDDIEYFLRRILKLAHLPWTRWKTPENQTTAGSDTVTFEELSHAKDIVSGQMRLASALLASFIVHLKLKRIWDDYGLQESNLQVEFTPPISWELHAKSQEVSKKTEMIKSMLEAHVMSRRSALKLCFDMDDNDVDRIDSEIRKEVLDDSVTEFFKAKITQAGPKGMNSPIPYVGEVPAAPAFHNMDLVNMKSAAPEGEGGESGGEDGGNPLPEMGGGPEGAPEEPAAGEPPAEGGVNLANLPSGPDAGGGDAGGGEPPPSGGGEEPANASEEPDVLKPGEQIITEPSKPTYKTTDMTKAETVTPKFDNFFNAKYGKALAKDYEDSEAVYGKRLSDISFMDILTRQARDEGYDGDVN